MDTVTKNRFDYSLYYFIFVELSNDVVLKVLKAQRRRAPG